MQPMQIHLYWYVNALAFRFFTGIKFVPFLQSGRVVNNEILESCLLHPGHAP
jgi:hypothetical protein